MNGFGCKYNKKIDIRAFLEGNIYIFTTIVFNSWKKIYF